MSFYWRIAASFLHIYILTVLTQLTTILLHLSSNIGRATPILSMPDSQQYTRIKSDEAASAPLCRNDGRSSLDAPPYQLEVMGDGGVGKSALTYTFEPRWPVKGVRQDVLGVLGATKEVSHLPLSFRGTEILLLRRTGDHRYRPRDISSSRCLSSPPHRVPLPHRVFGQRQGHQRQVGIDHGRSMGELRQDSAQSSQGPDTGWTR